MRVRAQVPPQPGSLILPAVVALAAIFRFALISGNYIIVPDTTIQVASAKFLVQEAALPYTYLDLPGPGLALLPVLLPSGYSLFWAQAGNASYGVLLVILVFWLVRMMLPQFSAAPYIAGLLVALNPSLVAIARIGFFESVQLAFALAFLIMVARAVTQDSDAWLAASFPVAAFLLILKEPNAIFVGSMYGWAGSIEIVRLVRRRRWSSRLLVLVGGGLLILVPMVLLITQVLAQDDKIGRASSGFGLTYLTRNLDAAVSFFRSPLDSPATGYFIFDHHVPMDARDWPGLAVQLVIMGIGLVLVARARRAAAFVAMGALLAYAAFFLFYSDWFSRFGLSILIVELILMAVALDWLASNFRESLPRRIAAAGLIAATVAIAGSAVRHDVTLLREWDSEASYIDNGILVRPTDVERLQMELYQQPSAYVVTTQAGLVWVEDPWERGDVLDLLRFGVERANAPRATDELKRRIEAALAAGRDVLYVPGIWDIENMRGLQPRGWGQYYDMIVNDLHAERLYSTRNFTSQKLRRARPTFMIYLLRRRG